MDGDRIHCYACDAVSPKGDDLLCPICHSDFTEIVEIPPETPEPQRSRSQESVSPNPWGDNSPWEEEDNRPAGFLGGSPHYNAFRTYRSPDGRFQFSSATFNPRSNDQQRAVPDPVGSMLIHNISSILETLAEPHERRPGGVRGMGENPFLSSTDPDWLHDDHLTGHHPGNMSPRRGDFPPGINHPMHMHKYVTDPLYPWASNLTSSSIMNAAQAEMGGMHNPGGPTSPFSLLSALLNMPFPRSGDAAYSQQEFDRLVTQLVENHGGPGTAAPPAPQSAILALPQKPVDKDMIGAEGNAECSICMESVTLGTKVAVLPCTHWFHFECIEAWLKQHDTCPHCRRSVSANTGGGDGTCENPVVIQDSPESSRRRRSSTNATRSGRASFSSIQNRLSPRMSPRRSPEPEARETNTRRASRGEGSGSISSWLSNRFGSNSA
ncbi:unnamed protein product [Penicillium olsonii]|uniref:RING-type E3 ubiquitin transferase n=1 Tax=Penicillium olsonii TaxID=99116 RepID=A0A9W4HAY2_PENOL|nr:unnamed protein product [Penicillium olsonii]CAG8065685.1 unnamed protein product [Penicillium olsonii]